MIAILLSIISMTDGDAEGDGGEHDKAEGDNKHIATICYTHMKSSTINLVWLLSCLASSA